MAGDEGGGAAAGDGTGGGEAERCGDEERDEGGGAAAGDGTGGGEAERCGDEERFCFFALLPGHKLEDIFVCLQLYTYYFGNSSSLTWLGYN